MAIGFVLSICSPALAYLPPISNAQMYTLATMGNVRALRAAIQRGLNIDTLDRNGNTALCHAIKQRNYTAYNTLRAAGANPNHPCMQNLMARNRDSFMQSRRVVPTTANSREAYAYLGEEDYLLSPTAWLIGGAILLGGILVAVMGGGGGGGNDFFFPLSYNETDYSLGGTVGTATPSSPETSNYNRVILDEQLGGSLTNGAFPDYNFGDGKLEGWVISNNSSIKVSGDDGATSQPLTDLIDFRYSALDYSQYIQVAMRGVNRSTVNNGYSPDSSRYDASKNYLITLKDNTAALVALKNSTANNYDTIKIDAKNGTLAMIASQSSTATNHANGLISMSFHGDKDNHSIVGMYADTNSTIINNGTISGTAKSADSIAGSMIGMRGQIINQEKGTFSTTTLTNNGNISFSASADNREISTGLVGMGSYVEDSFLNGSYLFSRAGNVVINNNGNIALDVALTGDNGTYSATDSDGNNMFLQGLSGIIGIRADGNTTATNSGTIQVSITDTGSEDNTVTESVAGMFSIRNGVLVNDKYISIDGGIGSYGMIAVRGDGKNPEIDQGNPSMTNNGTIAIDSKNGFGIASYNGGLSINNGTITLQQQGTGILHDTGGIENNNEITIQGGGTGIRMSQKGTINTNNNSSITIDNALTNDVSSSGSSGDSSTGDDSSTDSNSAETIGIYLEDGTVNNNGTITITNNTSASGTTAFAIKANKGTLNNNNTLSITNNYNSYGIVIENGTILNNGQISLTNSKGALDNEAYAIKSTQGDVTNNAALTISNKNNAYGIEALAGTVTNTAAISINPSTNLTSALAYGIKGGNSDIINSGALTINNATESYAISTENGDISNTANITLSNNNGALDTKAYAIKSTQGDVNNSASISISNKDETYAIEALAGNVDNTGTISINQNTSLTSKLAYGIKGGNSNISNDAAITINNATESYAISTENGDISNTANITLSNNNGALDTKAYAIKSTQGDVENSGNINIAYKSEAYAIEALAGTVNNTGTISINQNNNNITSTIAYGIKGGVTDINSNAEILINNAKESYGLSTENGYIVNNATITMGNTTGALDDKAYAIKSTQGDVDNNAEITISNKNEAYAIEALAGNIINDAAITINGNTGSLSNLAYGLKGGVGSITNNQTITINNANEQYGISTENGIVTNNADITLNNSQQAQNKTSYGIKAEKGSVINNANLYINTTGDLSQGIDVDTGSFGIWGNEANILNSKNSSIVFTKRGNGMHTESGLNQNYGQINMQAGGVGMSTSSGNAINYGSGVITIDDTGVGMKSGLGQASNQGQINITGSMSTGMESQNYAVNDGTINVTGYNSIGMSVTAENAQIINNKDIIMSSDHNGKLNYGMYGSTGVYSRMTNNGNITITGRQYPTTENIAYGMYLDEGEAKNYGIITLNDMFGYGMNLGTGGTLDNYSQIILNYGGIGIGGNGSGASDKETAATINHQGATITITGDNSYGMQMLGAATAWNDGTISVDGENSYGIFTTDGSGTNNNSITMAADSSIGMHSVSADIINKTNATVNIQGQNSVGIQTQDGGTSSTSIIGALNEGTINLEASSTGSIGMKVTGSGQARNKGTINVMSTGSSGMIADGSGTIDNSGDIDVTGDESYGMQATQGTATNNKNITINADDSYGMYADGGTIVNGLNGTITISDGNNSIYAMYVNSGSAENQGTLSFTKEGIIAMYARAGTAINNKIINVSGANSIAMQGEGDAQLTNNANITTSGDSSIGMEAGGNSTVTNELDGVITVNGPNSQGMVALGVILGNSQTQGTAINSGTIQVNDATSVAMYADGGIIKNSSTGQLITDGSIGMYVLNGQGVNEGIIENDNGNFKAMYVEAGSIENQGRITLNGENSIGMETNGSATASNALKNSVIIVNGANSIGMKATSGTASNYGIINANNASAVAMQADGGTIINEDGASLQSIGEVAMLVNSGTGINNGDISLAQEGIHAMRVVQGTITNNKTISLTGDNAAGMVIEGTGTATNETSGTISVSGANAYAMLANGAGTATNNGTLDVQNANSYAMYADKGGTIVNSSGATINTIGSSALYVNNGVAKNLGDITNNNNGFHAIHVVSGSGTNSGNITLNGSDAAGLYAQSGTLKNDGGTITMNGESNTTGILGETGTVSVTNSGTITVTASGASGTGIEIAGGSVFNKGSIKVTSASGTGISINTGSATNEAEINVTGNASVGMISNSGGQLTNAGGASMTVKGTGSIGMHAAKGGQVTNNGALTVEGDSTIGILVENRANGVNGGTLSVTGNKIVGMQANNSSTITNTSNIYVKGSEVVGMKATNNSKIDNQGTILFSGTTAGNTGTSNIFSIDSTSSILNQGTVASATTPAITSYSAPVTMSLMAAPMSFNDRGVYVGENGRFIASTMDGNLSVDGSALDEGNQSEYVLKNALTASDISNLKVKGTAWFSDVSVQESQDDVDLSDITIPSDNAEETSSQTNDETLTDDTNNNESLTFETDGLKNYNIVARKVALNSVLSSSSGIQDRALLNQIDSSYEAGKSSQVFNVLKYAETNADLANEIKGEFGLDLFANFTKQNFDVIKSADRQINATLLNNSDNQEIRVMAGYDFYGRKQDATAYIADYDDQAHSAFGLIDKKYNDVFRYGLGAMVTKYSSDYDDDTASRDEIMVHLLAPLSFQYGNSKLVSVPRIGMGFGDYTRHVTSGSYEGDVTNYYYGITNEARHTFDMGWFGLEPTLEFNVLGMYQGKIKEKDSALEINATNNISVETGIGLYAVKEIELGEKGKINLRAGGTYYHELANPFQAQKARMTDAGINYFVNSYDARRDRAVLSLRLDYRYKQFNLYSEFSKYIETDDAYAINAGLGYKF